MSALKHIEKGICQYIIPRYTRVCEIGVGQNFFAAQEIKKAGVAIFCTDVVEQKTHTTYDPPFFIDSVFSPRYSLYEGVELIYAIRPHEEMISALISLAAKVGSDLIVYHLGFEKFDGAVIIPGTSVPLFFYAFHFSKRNAGKERKMNLHDV
jgi:uncharacterized UPF0146 family protein